jgi:hypothetical protein
MFLGLGVASKANASDATCATGKLNDDHFQEKLSKDHDGVLVRLDVDVDAYLKSVRDDTHLSDSRREELLQQGSARLLKAKTELLAGSRFSIHRNLEFGSEVVILVDGMADVCELAANPHVQAIWVNSRWKVEPLLPGRPIGSPDDAAQ